MWGRQEACTHIRMWFTLQSDTKPCILMSEGATQQLGERSPPMICQLLMLPEALIFACSLKYSDVAIPPHDLPKKLIGKFSTSTSHTN